MDQVSIYLHEAGKFLFFLEDDTMPDNLLINKLKLKQVQRLAYFKEKLKKLIILF